MPPAPANDPADLGDVLLDELRELRSRRRVLGRKVARNSYDDPRPDADPRSLDEKLAAYDAGVQKLGDLSALCLSGGGIRSAAFALGVVQGLAARGLLMKFDYLSTVSGGGYLGGFLTTWVQRQGYDKVISELTGSAHRETQRPSPLQYLRRYSSYLTPYKGLLSADMLTVAALYLRNLALNWSILLPVIVVLLLAIKLVAIVFWGLSAIPTSIVLLSLAALILIGIAAVDSLQQRPGWEDVDSDSGKFRGWEMIPTMLGAFAASWAAFKYLEYVARVGADVDATGILITLAFIGGASAFIAWMSTLALSRPRDPNEVSTDGTIRTAGWKQRLWVLLSFTLAGVFAGLILGIAMVLPVKMAMSDEVKAFFFLGLGPPIVITALFAGELLYLGLTDSVPWSEMEREWLARACGYHSRAAAIWVLIVGLTFGGSFAIFNLGVPGQPISPIWYVGILGTIAGVLTAVLGKAPATDAALKRRRDSWRHRLARVGLALATPVFVVIAVALLSAALDWLLVCGALKKPVTSCGHGNFWTLLFGSAAAMIALGSAASFAININRCSLHGMYRNRLIRAFLGASNAQRGRRANRFIDFDEQDNIDLCALWPNATPLSRKAKTPQLLVVNCALNVVGARELAWQERKALSWTATPQWIGCGDLRWGEGNSRRGCYRVASEYGNGMSLGTAMTISGAAASPNMGYHSSPGLSVLLTLFNVRLGAWLGNPGPAGALTYRYEGPRFAARPLVQEALGLTTSDNAYVYLSDGGHFENLGLYEMVRRRCRLIIVSDGGCDPDCAFEDLGNAVRRIAIDLNVTITFSALKIGARKNPPVQGPYCAVARIIYDSKQPQDAGLLLYLKPGYQGIEPASVRSYAAANPAFPHESTADQLFGESQFEAYRALGKYVMQSIDGERQTAYRDIRQFITTVATELESSSRTGWS